MSTCTRWETELVVSCTNWVSKLEYQCVNWADEGYAACSEWVDHGHEACAAWGKKCHWYTPWSCVVEWLCTAFYWVADLVCTAWYWVTVIACKVFAWVVRWTCRAFGWALHLVCKAWDWLRCMLRAVVHGVKALFGRSQPERKKIEHVFVLALENRSFDHMLGMSGIPGGIDPSGAPTSFNDGFALASNPLPGGGTVGPSAPADFHLSGVDKGPGHEWEDVLFQLTGSSTAYSPATGYPSIDNSGYVQNYADTGSPTPERVMKCFSPEQLPVLNALAREFAVCDQWFSSVPGPTFPNRFFMMAASSGGLDGSPSSAEVAVAASVEGFRFENGNIFDLLDDHCIPWHIYEGDEFPAAFLLSGMNFNALQGRFSDFDEFEADVQKLSFAHKFVFIEPKYGLHEFDVLGPGDYTCGTSMHPLDDVTSGERLIKQVYEAIRKSPHWETSVLIVTFDENGGFYDHVVPPSAVPPGDTKNSSYVHHDFAFDQLGARVPALVISPHIPRGVIDHTVYDHTSILSTIESLWRMKPLTERDRQANDLLHLVSLDTPRTDAPLTLPSPAVNPSPLDCDTIFSASVDALLELRADLVSARKEASNDSSKALDHDHEAGGGLRPSTSVGFLQVALLRVLTHAGYPERDRWIEDYRAIASDVDAAIFMTEAQLAITHGVDVKRFPNQRPRRAGARRSHRRGRPHS